jgi:hypothetical protein
MLRRGARVITSRERLAIGSMALFAAAVIVGTQTDDALGHDAMSLAIGLAAAFLIIAIGGPIVLRWAKKVEK